MATISFDDKVIVTDPDTARRIREELSTPVAAIKEEKTICTHKDTEENAKKWITRWLI